MSRRTEAPPGMDCPYRHACPHLDGLSAAWALENYHEAFELRQRLEAMQQGYEQRLAELEKALRERDDKIAQLQAQHRKHFKANKPAPPPQNKPRRRGAPVGHPGWHRRPPGPIDRSVEVAAPRICPHCQCQDLLACSETYEHLQEDIVLVPHPLVTRFLHHQKWCPLCRRPVYQPGEGELPGCQIGPVTRAVATHLRYGLQIPYRKVQYILASLFGMPLVPASAMNFDRKSTARARPLYEQLRAMLKSSAVVYADETSWREDGHGHFVWYGGNEQMAFFQITPDRSAASAVELLGEAFDGTLVSDDYAAYNAVHPRRQQTCWAHIAAKCKEIVQQIKLVDPPIRAPRSLRFCRKLKALASKLCGLGRSMRHKKLSLARASAMVPRLQRQLRRLAATPLDHPAAETLRQRVLLKDKDKLFTFLRVKGVEPTNNHAERSVRPLVIMRKICFGTRSPEGSQSHSVLPSLLQTARRQGREAIGFLVTLLTRPLSEARSALFARGP
jgi:transposase